MDQFTKNINTKFGARRRRKKIRFFVDLRAILRVFKGKKPWIKPNTGTQKNFRLRRAFSGIYDAVFTNSKSQLPILLFLQNGILNTDTLKDRIGWNI